VIIKHSAPPPSTGSSEEVKNVKVPARLPVRPMQEPIRRKLTPKLEADPASLETSAEEVEDKSSAFRYLWPFQVSVVKTKGHGLNHHHGG